MTTTAKARRGERRSRKNAGPLVNKRDLATKLDCSVPKIDALLQRYPDFPVVTPGTNGRAWQFDAQAVIDFLVEKRRQEEEEARARNEALNGLALPFDDDDDTTLSAKQHLELIKAAKAGDELKLSRGQLVETARLRQVLQAVFAKLGQRLNALPDEICRRHNLPDGAELAIRQTLEEERRRLVAEIQDELGEAFPAAPGEEAA